MQHDYPWKKYRTLKDKALPKVCIPLLAIVLKIRVLSRDTIDREISCDSRYMLATIDRVGKALRQKIWWVKLEDIVFSNYG